MNDFYIDRDQLLSNLSEMIRCPSVNTLGVASDVGAEAAMADLFEGMLR